MSLCLLPVDVQAAKRMWLDTTGHPIQACPVGPFEGETAGSAADGAVVSPPPQAAKVKLPATSRRGSQLVSHRSGGNSSRYIGASWGVRPPGRELGWCARRPRIGGRIDGPNLRAALTRQSLRNHPG